MYQKSMVLLFALKSLSGKLRNKHIKILSDSTTAVRYIASMGGVRSLDCDKVTREIWNWCLGNKC